MRFDFSLSRRACAQLGIGVLAGAALGSSWARAARGPAAA